MILAACRKKAISFSLTSDGEAIYEAIQELFESLGGVTLELLIDNPKALVIENNPKSEEEVNYNPKALLLAAHLGTELNACNCYWPRVKAFLPCHETDFTICQQTAPNAVKRILWCSGQLSTTPNCILENKSY